MGSGSLFACNLSLSPSNLADGLLDRELRHLSLLREARELAAAAESAPELRLLLLLLLPLLQSLLRPSSPLRRTRVSIGTLVLVKQSKVSTGSGESEKSSPLASLPLSSVSEEVRSQ